MIIKIQNNYTISFLKIPTKTYSLKSIFNYSDFFLKSVLYQDQLEQKYHFLENSIDEITKLLKMLSQTPSPAKTFLLEMSHFKYPTTKPILNNIFEQSKAFKNVNWTELIKLFKKLKINLQNEFEQNKTANKINIVLLFLLFQNPLIKMKNIQRYIEDPKYFFQHQKSNECDIFLNFDERKIVLTPKIPQTTKNFSSPTYHPISLENTMFFEEFLIWNQRIISQKISYIWIKNNSIATLYKIN